jgi:hypothetical protein
VFPLHKRFTNTDFRQCVAEIFSLQHGSWRYISKINKRKHYIILPTKICNKLSFSLCFIYSFFIGVHFPAASRHSYFPLVYCVNVSLWDHGASFSVGTRGKVAGQEAHHSSWSSTKVTNALNYTSTPPYAFITWCVFMLGKISYSLTSYQYWSDRVFALDSEGIQFEQIAGCFKLECDKSNLQYFFIDSKLAHR